MNKYLILVINSLAVFILSMMAYIGFKEDIIINIVIVYILVCSTIIMSLKDIRLNKFVLGLITLIGIQLIIFVVALYQRKEYVLMVTVIMGLAIIIYIMINYLENIRDD